MEAQMVQTVRDAKMGTTHNRMAPVHLVTAMIKVPLVLSVITMDDVTVSLV